MGAAGLLAAVAAVTVPESASGNSEHDKGATVAAETVTVVAAGDLCGSACNQTAKLVSKINPTAVITLGDNAYKKGTASEFREKYAPNWGKFRDKTYPTPGNHDYDTNDAEGYFDYFGSRAGTKGKGYYSYDLGDWHFVALNSEISAGSGSTQEKWLRADLKTNKKPCTAAYLHRPQFSTGDHGDDSKVKPLFTALYENKADLFLSGHDHHYERFAPSKPSGAKDTANGLRQLVVGTGGTTLRDDRNDSKATTEKVNMKTFGVAKLTLSSTGYEHEFVPVEGRTFTDKVSGKCHKASATSQSSTATD
ncbi:metallophosphoesterase family protein [Streptomyces sp. NPDC059037]|uniref:metallophosphoesterase family protein n=1 Tax=Streptomyces sp. NPDC059037 TaxID=3346710 RepID=UPI003685E2EE